MSLVEAQPFQGKKKGADGGIDGLKFFHDVDKAGARKIVVSVKGGGNLKADDIRSLMAVRERESAEIALFISLEEPTRGMIADAASSGCYESATGKKFPRVQLLTIEGLLSGKQRAAHPDHQPDLNFKKAKAAAGQTPPDSCSSSSLETRRLKPRFFDKIIGFSLKSRRCEVRLA